MHRSFAPAAEVSSVDVDAIRYPKHFFSPLPVLRVVPPENWRDRLRQAMARSGKKHSAIAHDAGVAPETLSRILNGAHRSPAFETIVRIAHAVDENVGWLVDERGFVLSRDEQQQLQKAVGILADALRSAKRRERQPPNAAAIEKPGEIPRPYVNRGARMVYEATDDSMIGAGIAEHDLLFVKPQRSTREALGRVVVCRISGEDYLKVLDVRGGRIRLMSRNDHYPPIELSEHSQRFELVGVVVGRTGTL